MGDKKNAFDNIQYVGRISDIKKAEEFIKHLPFSLNAEGCIIDARDERNLKIYPVGLCDNARIMLPDDEKPNKYKMKHDLIAFKKEVVRKGKGAETSLENVPYQYFWVDDEKRPPYNGVGIRLKESSEIQFL